MKRMIPVLLAALLSLCSCSASNHTYYERAQIYLGAGEYEAAARLFSSLGEYRDSADYALYCAGLRALTQGEYDLARANMTQVEPFKSSERYLRYLDALSLSETDGEAALAQFTALGSFEDSQAHADALRERLPREKLSHARALMKSGQYASALSILSALDHPDAPRLAQTCQEAIDQAVYDQASALYAAGSYEAALTAFEALGDALDAPDRTAACRDALYRALEKDYPRVTLESASALMERYAALGDYRDCAQHLAALTNRYGRALQLLQDLDEHPYVCFGEYPAAETGEPAPLLWQVTGGSGSTVTLLCCRVIDALPVATSTDLLAPLQQAEAVSALSLPSAEDAARLPDALLSGVATPYAVAQGVRSRADGSAWWWLQDAVVDADGAIVDMETDNTALGIRPQLVLSLEDHPLTQGSGTLEDPYR